MQELAEELSRIEADERHVKTLVAALGLVESRESSSFEEAAGANTHNRDVPPAA